MTITFENDNDIIVYTLEKIISYARNTQQIFVAQCVWWLASITGLEQGLTIHINNLQQRKAKIPQESCKPIVKGEESSVPSRNYSGRVHPDKTQQILVPKVDSLIPRDLQNESRLGSGETLIHPDRRNQVDSTHLPISDLDLDATELEPRKDIVEAIREFLLKSRKERKAFRKGKKVDQLSRTRIVKPLSQGQRQYLQCIPKDTIREYLENRK
jgi:hypothetical protein